MRQKITTLAAGFLFCVLTSYGQQKVSTASEQDRYHKFDSSLAIVQLDTLPDKINALYSKGYETRAILFQSLVKKVCTFYERAFPEITFTTQLLILDTADFKKVLFPLQGRAPYGMPFSISKRNLIVMGADKKAVSKLFGPDNTPDSVLSGPDEIAIHELGHIFFGTLKNIYPKEHWASEFLANYFAECYYAETDPHFFEDMNDPALNDAPKYQPKYQTLEDFERLYIQVGPRNYGWYQGRFSDLCDKLYPKFKIALIPKLSDYYASHASNAELLTYLKQIAPEITNKWLDEMK